MDVSVVAEKEAGRGTGLFLRSRVRMAAPRRRQESAALCPACRPQPVGGLAPGGTAAALLQMMLLLGTLPLSCAETLNASEWVP